MAVAVAIAAAVLAHPRPALAAPDAAWTPDVRSAAAYAESRRGTVSFAAIDEQGRRHSYRAWDDVQAASVFKVMLLAAYLRQGTVKDRSLREGDRDLLEPMIRWSDNHSADRVMAIVGKWAIYRLARSAEMEDFTLHTDPWGRSLTTAREQAPFLHRLERYIPERHRAYARQLLETIVPSQRWGIAAEAPPAWRLFFKGGWGYATGRVAHQVAFLERDGRRVALAVMTEFSPSHAYGTETVRGVAARLLADL